MCFSSFVISKPLHWMTPNHQQCLTVILGKKKAYSVKVSPNFRWLIDQLDKQKSRAQAICRSLSRSLSRDLTPQKPRKDQVTACCIYQKKWNHHLSFLISHYIQKKLNHHQAYFTSSFLHTGFFHVFRLLKKPITCHTPLNDKTTTSSLNPLPPKAKESQSPRKGQKFSPCMTTLFFVYDRTFQDLLQKKKCQKLHPKKIKNKEWKKPAAKSVFCLCWPSKNVFEASSIHSLALRRHLFFGKRPGGVGPPGFSLKKKPRVQQGWKLVNCLPSLKLTAILHLKMDGWNTILSYWDGLFSGAMLVSGRVYPSKTSGKNRSKKKKNPFQLGDI